MRGYYGFFGNNLYELDRVDPARTLTNFTPNNCDKKSWNQDGSIDLQIHLTNFNVAAESNKEMYEYALRFIKDHELTSLKKLSDEYGMYLKFSVIDNNSDELIDGGILVKTLTTKSGLFPLGITDDNEYVVRFVMSTDPVSFKRCYRDNRPLGITVQTPKDYSIRIERIQLTQYLVKTFAEVPVDDKNGRFNRRDIDPVNRPPRSICGPRHTHPSISYVDSVPFTSDSNAIVVYDSEVEGLKFDPIRINSKLKEIRFNIDIDLNNYFVAADKSDIASALEANVNKGEEGDVGGGDIGDDDPPVIINPTPGEENPGSGEERPTNPEEGGTKDPTTPGSGGAGEETSGDNQDLTDPGSETENTQGSEEVKDSENPKESGNEPSTDTKDPANSDNTETGSTGEEPTT